MISRFFTGKADSNLNDRGKIQSGDMYISKYEFKGKATWDDAAKTFTLDTTDTIVDDAYNSAMKNLLVYDDNGKVAWAKVTDTAGTAKTVTIDDTDLYLLEDGVTLATLTDATEYDVNILTPTAAGYDYSGEYGSFAGYVELSFNITEENVKLDYGVPSKTVWKDRVGMTVELTGNTKMVSESNTLAMALKAVLYGKQTGQASYGISTNPGPSEDFEYMVAVVGRDRGGLLGVDYWWRCQVEPSGETPYFNKEYKMFPFRADVLAHGFFPEDKADYAMMVRQMEGS